MTDYDFLTDAGIPRISSISASQALRASSTQYPSTTAATAAISLSTGLDGLDNAIHTASTRVKEPDYPVVGPRSYGIPRGSITEIYGPPGVGKTAISLNIAAKTLTLAENEKVIWIDTGSPIPRLRLKNLLISNIKKSSSTDVDDGFIDQKLTECMSRFYHLRTPSLPHLLSLFAQPPTNFPAEDTAVLIVDSISAPFQPYFPNATELKTRQQLHTQSRNSPSQQQMQWLLSRKWNVTSDMANKMMKLAASRSIAIILLNQTHTKIKGQPRPTLYPALAGGSWENCIYTRIVLYRDWPPSSSLAQDQAAGKGSSTVMMTSKVRYAEIMKKGGKVINVRTDDNIVPFLIENDGLRELIPSTTTAITAIANAQHQEHQQEHQQDQQPQKQPPNTILEIAALQSSPPPFTQTQLSSISQSTSTMTVRKRKVDEIADSEDEDLNDDDDEGFLNGEDDD